MKIARQNILNTGIATTSQLILLSTNFLVFFILIKSSGISQFGVWALFITVVSITDTIRQGFIHHTLISKYIQCNHEKHKLIAQYAWINYLIIGLNSLVIFIIAPLLSSFWNSTELLELLTLYPLMAIALGTIQYLNTVFIARQRFNYQLLTNLSYFLFVILGIGFVLWNGIDTTPKILIYIQFFAGILVLTYLVIKERIYCSLPTIRVMKEAWCYGRYTSSNSMLSLLFQKIDFILIGYFLSPLGVSLYLLGGKIINYCELPINSLSQVLFPKFTGYDKEKLASLYIKSALLITASILPVVIITYSYTDFIIQLIGKETYLPVRQVVHILLIGTLIKPWGRVFGLMLDAIGKPEINFQMLLISVIINTSLNLILIPIWGIEGAALATTTSIAITIIIGQIRLGYYMPWAAKFHVPIKNFRTKYQL